MALKVELKPGERVIIGNCVIINSDQRTRFLVEGQVPILREKDILTAKTADSAAKRIYFAIQLMYTAKDPSTIHDVYFNLIKDFLQAAPSSQAIIQDINNHILIGEMYKALKTAKKLIAYELELLENAKRGAGVRVRRQEDRKSP
jgi:flagellar protein FlbT